MAFENITYEKKGDGKFLTDDVLDLLEGLTTRLEGTTPFDQATLEKTLLAFLEEKEIKLKRIR